METREKKYNKEAEEHNIHFTQPPDMHAIRPKLTQQQKTPLYNEKHTTAKPHTSKHRNMHNRRTM